MVHFPSWNISNFFYVVLLIKSEWMRFVSEFKQHPAVHELALFFRKIFIHRCIFYTLTDTHKCTVYTVWCELKQNSLSSLNQNKAIHLFSELFLYRWSAEHCSSKNPSISISFGMLLVTVLSIIKLHGSPKKLTSVSSIQAPLALPAPELIRFS